MQVFLKYCQLRCIILIMGRAVAKADSDAVESISPNHNLSMYTGQKAVIVDVREDCEWNEQHIPGAIHVPLAQLNERLPELRQYQNSPLITQCKSGRRSAHALEVLKSDGFSKVYNMDGGIMAWDQTGLKTN